MNAKKDLSDDFGAHVSQCLATFQVIEASLKMYITYSLKLIRVRLGESIPFAFDGADYENAALETLVKAFAKLTNNRSLVSLLRKVIASRNFVAHQALIVYMSGSEDGSHHIEHSKRIERIAIEAAECLLLLQRDLADLNGRIMGLSSSRRAQ